MFKSEELINFVSYYLQMLPRISEYKYCARICETKLDQVDLYNFH